MKIFLLLVSFLPLASGLDLVSLMAASDEKFKKYPQDPSLIEDVYTPDAVLCMEDECAPYKQVLDNWFEGVKTFDYVNDIRSVGERVVSGRCYDYIDYHDIDCHTMFYVDWVTYFNDDGMVEKHIAMMTDEQHALAFKCVNDKAKKETK